MVPRLLLFCTLWALTADAASAKLNVWHVGGKERRWAQWEESAVVMDDTSNPGRIRPQEFHPEENIVRTLFSGKIETDWSSRPPSLTLYYREGMPCCWWGIAGGEGRSLPLVDGDWDNSYSWELNEQYAPHIGEWFTIDLGIPMPVNKVVFGPPQTDQLTPLLNRPRRENYMKGYKFSAAREKPDWLDEEHSLYRGIREWTKEWTNIRQFKDVLVENMENTKSLTVIAFPTQYLRFFRIQNTIEAPFEIGEIEIYGEGFTSRACYTSKIIDLQQIANFGRIWWKATKWRRNPEGVVERVPEVSARMVVETRSGNDTTPLIYHQYTDKHRLKVVDEDTWLKLEPYQPGKPIRPYMRGPVTYDEENWSHWSVPAYQSPGKQIISPGPARYFQFRITIWTDDFRETISVDSLWFEFSSPPLAEKLLGEIALLNDPSPPGEISVVDPGAPATFTYDIKASFSSPLQSGFDSLQINLPSQALFKRLQVGNRDGFVTIACEDSVLGSSVYKDLLTGKRIYVDTASPEKMVLYFPSQPIAPGSWDRLRVVFCSSVLVYGNRFTGKVWKSGRETLPQTIQPGDANSEVTTDKLTVLVKEQCLGTVLDAVEVSPKVVTPNGDGANDAAKFSYKLLQITGKVEVEIAVFDLSGTRVRTVYRGSEARGIYEVENKGSKFWKGDNQQGELVAPGLYIWQISVSSDSGCFNKIGTIAVVY